MLILGLVYRLEKFEKSLLCKYKVPAKSGNRVIDLKLELNTEKEGCMSYTTPEDAQRPRAVYDIHPDFRGI